MRYAQALADWADAGGYEAETLWDMCTVAALGVPFDRAQYRACDHACPAASRSGWCWRRCCAARTRCCCWTSRTTTWTSPASAGWRSSCASRRRRCCSSATTASCWPGPPPGSSRSNPARPAARRGCTAAASRRTTQARERTESRGFEELRRRWDEEHAKLKELVLMYKQKAAFSSDMASRYQAAQTRLAQVRGGRAAAGAAAASRRCTMRLKGGRTGQAGGRSARAWSSPA